MNCLGTGPRQLPFREASRNGLSEKSRGNYTYGTPVGTTPTALLTITTTAQHKIGLCYIQWFAKLWQPTQQARHELIQQGLRASLSALAWRLHLPLAICKLPKAYSS